MPTSAGTLGYVLWIVVIAAVVIAAAFAGMAIAAIHGIGKAKLDGWSPAEAVIGRKIWSKDRKAADK